MERSDIPIGPTKEERHRDSNSRRKAEWQKGRMAEWQKGGKAKRSNGATEQRINGRRRIGASQRPAKADHPLGGVADIPTILSEELGTEVLTNNVYRINSQKKSK